MCQSIWYWQGTNKHTYADRQYKLNNFSISTNPAVHMEFCDFQVHNLPFSQEHPLLELISWRNWPFEEPGKTTSCCLILPWTPQQTGAGQWPHQVLQQVRPPWRKWAHGWTAWTVSVLRSKPSAVGWLLTWCSETLKACKKSRLKKQEVFFVLKPRIYTFHVIFSEYWRRYTTFDLIPAPVHLEIFHGVGGKITRVPGVLFCHLV